jgi:hypothetical protein
MYMSTSVFAQSLSISPNPVYVGGTVTVSVDTTCNGENVSGYPIIYGLSVTWTNESTDGSGNATYTGYATPTTAGTPSVTGTTPCGSNVGPFSLTVAQFTNILILDGPTNSAFQTNIIGTSNDWCISQSPSDGDVAVFKLNITPWTALAATLATWTGAAPATPTNNLTATYPATSVAGPIAVFATPVQTAPTSPVPPPAATLAINVWVFWASIDYTFTGVLTTGDHLSFGNPWLTRCLPDTNICLNYVGPDLTAANFVMANQVEIVGSLSPHGIGAKLNFVIAQMVEGYAWTTNSENPTSTNFAWDDITKTVTPGAGTFVVGLNEQIPANGSDQIFAIDAPGPNFAAATTSGTYNAQAGNFIDWVYVGTTAVSDYNEWAILDKGKFNGAAASPPITNLIGPWDGYGPITLPVTWDDDYWHQFGL